MSASCTVASPIKWLTAVALQHPDVKVLSLGSAAPLRRVLPAQREDKVTPWEKLVGTGSSPAGASRVTSPVSGRVQRFGVGAY
jgi:hypothetical protein